jgi:urease accessory protein UreH
MRYLLATLTICLAMMGISSAQQDPFAGTWKLNVAKSKMQKATASQRETLILQVVDGEESVLTDAVTIDGEPEVMKYTARYDGKVYTGATTIIGKTLKVQKMNVVLRKIDARTRERVSMDNGKVTSIARRVLSEDGKTLTSSIMTVDKDGKESVREIRVFERQ